MTFTAKGRTVHQEPVRNKNEDGTTSTTLGFPAFTVSDWCDDNAAREIARQLNAIDGLVDALNAIDLLIPEPSLPLTHQIKEIVQAALAKAGVL